MSMVSTLTASLSRGSISATGHMARATATHAPCIGLAVAFQHSKWAHALVHNPYLELALLVGTIIAIDWGVHKAKNILSKAAPKRFPPQKKKPLSRLQYATKIGIYTAVAMGIHLAMFADGHGIEIFSGEHSHVEGHVHGENFAPHLNPAHAPH